MGEEGEGGRRDAKRLAKKCKKRLKVERRGGRGRGAVGSVNGEPLSIERIWIANPGLSYRMKYEEPESGDNRNPSDDNSILPCRARQNQKFKKIRAVGQTANT